jgi:hypothetical protein
MASPDWHVVCKHELHAELPALVDPASPLQVGGLELSPLELLLHPTITATAAGTAVANIARISCSLLELSDFQHVSAHESKGDRESDRGGPMGCRRAAREGVGSW